MENYRNPSLTADIFIFDDDLNFILIKRKHEPFKNYWALPGGFVEYGESVEDAAIREAKEETSIDIELLDLVGVYSDPGRDPRGHSVTVAYTAKGNIAEMDAQDDALEIDIFNVKNLDEIKLAFDHDKIIKDCLKIIKSEFWVKLNSKYLNN